jgi:membrane-associated protease RseP (regulator of RpoE activity)
MQNRLRPFLLGMALFAALLLSSGKVAGAQRHTAPLELLQSGHLAIQVRINGQGPYRMILDTGSPLTFISTRVARELGVLPPQQNKPAQPPGLAIGGQAVLKTITVGDTELKDLNALILDHPIVEALGGVFGRLDGIVGFSFFAHFYTTIDYLNALVSFEPVEYQPQDMLNGMMLRLLGSSQKERVIAARSLWGLTVAATPQNDGVAVSRVYRSSAAAAAGFRPGDRIEILDDRWTDTVNDLYEAAALTVANQPVVVKVVRGKKEILLTVRPRPGI